MHPDLFFLCSFMKIGTMVFLCHDINDVFMEVAKLSKYAKRENLANALFALFVISWFFTRMFYFPLWIIRSAWSEPITVRLFLPTTFGIRQPFLFHLGQGV